MNSSYLAVHKQSIVKLLILSMIIGLTACGGGGHKSPSTPTPDITPADFSFTLPQGGVYAPGEMATTDPITITDIDELVDISISAGGEYAINDGSFTSSAGQIASNQSLVARAAAPTNFGETLKVTLTVGTVEQSFTVASIARDIIPDTFSFSALSDVGLSAKPESTAVTITGINDAAPVTIEGGEYAIAGGEYADAEGTVTKDQTITVRLTASNAFSTTSTAKLTVGGVEADFAVTTLARDITPKAFGFSPESDADFETLYTSNNVKVSEINDAAPVTISGGEYAVNGGTYTTAPGTVVDGDTVSVRLTSAASGGTTTNATLNIGGVDAVYTVTTVQDLVSPVVELYFPTQLGITDKATLRVRGVASDDLSGVSYVKVNGVDAETSDDYATWQATIDLALGENEISLIAEDGSGNITPSKVFATITRSDDLTGAYNVVDETMERFYGLQFLPETEQLFFVEDRRNFYFMNPETGAVTMASAAVDPVNHDTELNGRTFGSGYYSINGEKGMYVGGRSGVYHVNLGSGERTLLSDISFSDNTLPFDTLSVVSVYEGVSLDKSYLLVGDVVSPQLIKVNLQTGEKQAFSDNNDTSLGVEVSSGINEAHISPDKKKVYVVTSSGIYSINLDDESRTLIADNNDVGNGIKIPTYGTSLINEGSELCGHAIDNGSRYIPCIDVSEGGGLVRRLLSDSVPPDVIDAFSSSASWEAKGLFYTSYATFIAVTDMFTGEHVVLMKVEG